MNVSFEAFESIVNSYIIALSKYVHNISTTYVGFSSIWLVIISFFYLNALVLVFKIYISHFRFY